MIEGGKIIVIPTGEWLREVEIYPFINFEGRTYSVNFITVKEIENEFIRKYGENHFNRYFMNSSTAIMLENLAEPPEVNYDTIGKIFDMVAPKYSHKVGTNWVQHLMRERSAALLREYIRPGDRILDLGSGPDSEIFKVKGMRSVTEVDVSKSSLRIAEDYHGRDSVNYLLLRDLEEISGEYEIIFSTFGYLNIEKKENLERIVERNLKEGGILVGAFLNKFGLMDTALNTMLLRWSYVKEKMRGKLSVNYSRYGMISYPRSPSFVNEIKGLRPEYVSGICLILPPYYFSRLVKFSEKIAIIGKIENLMLRFPFLWRGADYILFVSRKVKS